MADQAIFRDCFCRACFYYFWLIRWCWYKNQSPIQNLVASFSCFFIDSLIIYFNYHFFYYFIGKFLFFLLLSNVYSIFLIHCCSQPLPFNWNLIIFLFFYNEIKINFHPYFPKLLNLKSISFNQLFISKSLAKDFEKLMPR